MKCFEVLSEERPLHLEGASLKRYLIALNYARGKTVLDIGTGVGEGSHLMAIVAKKVIGVDYSPKAIRYATKNFKLPNLNFKVLDARGINHLKKRFDIITAFEIIEHLPCEQEKLIQNAKKILNKNGKLLISTPNKLFSSQTNPYHHREYEPEEFLLLLKKNFPKTELFGLKCINNTILKKTAAITKKPINILAIYLSRYKFFHKLNGTIPPWFRNLLTSKGKLPIPIPSDFKLFCGTKLAKDCETLLAICKK